MIYSKENCFSFILKIDEPVAAIIRERLEKVGIYDTSESDFSFN